jgi:hypothetical protein
VTSRELKGKHPSRLAQAMREAGNSGVYFQTMPVAGHNLELATLGYQFDEISDAAIA